MGFWGNVWSLGKKAVSGLAGLGKKFLHDAAKGEIGQKLADKAARFVVLHHSILSEGINVKGLEAALFLRNMNYVGISQTIGRVIRKGNESKVYGLVVVPCYDRVGISTAKSITAVVDIVFNKGKAAVSTIKR